jgi:hypothetical protein
MDMTQRILLTMMLFLLFGIQSAFGQATPETVHNKVSSAIGVEGQAQNKADDWTWDKKDILDDIRDLKYRITWLQYRQEKNRIYIEGVKENIENLEFQKAEINKLREQLEPYLEETILRLEDFIASDMPFLPQERARRIEALKASMNNYNVSLSEKLRRVFAEGLQIETEYGRMVEAIEDETLTINGNETQVLIFRLGRIAMLYISLDGTQIGHFNNISQQWENLPDNLNRNVRRAMDIAQAKRSAEIVEIPLSRSVIRK